jgi:enoyl-CoA hydratase/carnithine racemase
MGLAAGDHAAMIWPLLCGMAKAKLYLLTADSLDGREAERIGLVSRAEPREQVLETAMAYARRLSRMPQTPLHFTKKARIARSRRGSRGSPQLRVAPGTCASIRPRPFVPSQHLVNCAA